MRPPLSLFAACQPGLEPLLAREIAGLGAQASAAAGGVDFSGDLLLALRAARWLVRVGVTCLAATVSA
jgi:23S rRNA G2445 N2-methylase RlmL